MVERWRKAREGGGMRGKVEEGEGRQGRAGEDGRGTRSDRGGILKSRISYSIFFSGNLVIMAVNRCRII